MSNFNTASLAGRGIKPLVSLLAHPRLALAVLVVLFLATVVSVAPRA